MSDCFLSSAASGAFKPFTTKLSNGRYAVISHVQPLSVGCDFGVDAGVCIEAFPINNDRPYHRNNSNKLEKLGAK
ncbi:MAG: hypothetical protein HRU28_13435 [Rhizobiales bacterium]|nr:hypothetical protein [Hyphomicrobiales bacterium]